MAKENLAFVIKSKYFNENNVISFSVYKNDQDETCFRISGLYNDNYFACEWHELEENALEEAHSFYKIRLWDIQRSL